MATKDNSNDSHENNNNNAPGGGKNGEGWTTVTKDDKKRVMRRRRKGRNSNGHVVAAVAHPTAPLSGTVHDPQELLQILSDCRNRLEETSWFQNCMKQLRQHHTSTTSQNNSIMGRRWMEIICFGIGNFEKTYRFEYSASLWQLAFALLLREELHQWREQQQQQEENNNHGKSKERTIPNSTNQQVSKQRHISTADCTHTKQNQKNDCGNNNITIQFHDPASTEREVQFLSNQLGVNVLKENHQGNYIIGPKRSAVVFMPHCPLFLYENFLSCNVSEMEKEEEQQKLNRQESCDCSSHEKDPIVPSTKNDTAPPPKSGSSILLIGNSLRNYCDALQTPVEIPWIQSAAAQNRFNEVPLPYTSHDVDIAPGNFVGAFNDTYLTCVRV